MRSPALIQIVAQQESVSLGGTSLFFHEVYEEEFDGTEWHPYAPEASFPTNLVIPADKKLEGFDVVTFFAESSPECSPLSCNGLAAKLSTNVHCLFASFEEAKAHVASGAFNDSEPGPYRIFSIYSVEWP